jgi:APA family basic amino acid/polyamine antiporter
VLVASGIFLIIAAGLSSGKSDLSHVFELTTSNNTSVTASHIFTAMLSAFWAYQGWAAVGYIGGEIKNAHRNIPKGIAIGVLTVIAIYLLVNVTYLSLLSVDRLEQIYTSGNSIAAVEAVRVFWGNNGAVFISFLIMLTTLGCTHATILASSRPYFAMAKEGLFFSKAGQLNKAQAPSGSLIYQCTWACLLVFSGTFDQLTDMIIFAVFIYYGATTLGVFILRKRMPNHPRPYKVWGYPVVPAVVILFCVLLFFNTIVARPREAGIGLVLMLTGIPMYWWFTRGNKRNAETS